MKHRHCKDCLYVTSRCGGLYCVATRKGAIVDAPVRSLTKCPMGYTEEDFAILDRMDLPVPSAIMQLKYGVVKKLVQSC